MTPTLTSPDPSQLTNVQIKVLLLLCLMNLLNCLDRDALSMIAPLFRRELHLNPLDYAYAVNAFLVAYAIMYAGSGAIVDRLGYRLSLALFVGASSLVAGLHAAVTGLWTLVAFRFLLGMAEPGGFTGGVKTLAVRLTLPSWAWPRWRRISFARESSQNICSLGKDPFLGVCAFKFGGAWQSPRPIDE